MFRSGTHGTRCRYWPCPRGAPCRGRCQRRAGASPTCAVSADHVSSAAAPSRRTEYPTHCPHWRAPRPVSRKLPMPEQVEQSMRSIYETRCETGLAADRALSARNRVVPGEPERPQLGYDRCATRGDLLPMPDIRKAHHLESANGCFGFCGLSGPKGRLHVCLILRTQLVRSCGVGTVGMPLGAACDRAGVSHQSSCRSVWIPGSDGQRHHRSHGPTD